MNQMQSAGLLLSLLGSAMAQTSDSTTKVRPEFTQDMDLTWCNGSDRRSTLTLAGKFFTPTIMVDANTTHSNHNPIDNTVVGSTALARNNEMQVSAAHLGADFQFEGARAHIVTQFGTRSTVIPRNDLSPYRGQFQLAEAYRYLAEANAGYHFKILSGLNVDVGMFMSYIGLNSYYQVENWEYQASFTSDNTPWFFNGLRLQLFVNQHLKIEPWIINGWQSYGMFNKQPGIGGNITWVPNENIKLLTNNYYGADAAGLPGRKRFHSDNSFLWRYFKKGSKINQAAFSITGDIGFEKGDGVNGFTTDVAKGPAQYFASIMFYHRLWFAHSKFAWTIGGGYMNNPGRYLVLVPSGQASPLPSANAPTSVEGNFPFSANPGDKFEGADCSTNIDWLPNEHVAFRLELVHRRSSINYFAGRGGISGSTGYSNLSSTANWQPDLVKSESRVIFAVLFRL